MGVAQLVERRVVVADVAGSSPVAHPTFSLGHHFIVSAIFECAIFRHFLRRALA